MSTVVTETTETTSTVLECFSMAQKFYTRPANGTLSAYGNEAEARNTGTNPMADTPIVKAFKIRIISGPYVGRYVGMHFGVGMVSIREVLKNPPVNLPGMDYAAWVQERNRSDPYHLSLHLNQFCFAS